MKSENLLQRISNRLVAVERNSPILQADGFAALYERTYLSIFRYIFGLTGGPQPEVEDLTAETYMRAWKNRQNFVGDPADGIAWVLRIARNLVIDRYRIRQRSFMLDEDELEPDELALPLEENPEGLLIQMEQQQLILVLMKKLPSAQREILVLRYILNWKVRKIGEYLEIPENTVSVSIRRSLEKLRSQWPVEKEITQ